jgi:hypothetical protein
MRTYNRGQPSGASTAAMEATGRGVAGCGRPAEPPPATCAAAASLLIDATGQDLTEDVIGWDRALHGYVMLALDRLGLD